MTKAEADSLAQALDAIRRLKETQASLIADLKSAREKQVQAGNKIKLLGDKVASLGKALVLNRPSRAGTDPDAVRVVSEQLPTIKARCSDSENRLWRSNLLFFAWMMTLERTGPKSEQKITDFCADKLGIKINEQQFEWTHRLAKYSDDKRRPIIAKLTLLRTKIAFSLPRTNSRERHLSLAKIVTGNSAC